MKGWLFCALLLASCGTTETVQGFPDSFVGVGLELSMEGETPVVVKALPGSPAATAGVQGGDRMVAIDNKPVTGWSLGDVVMKLRGKPETQVALTMLRDSSRVVVVVRRQPMSKTANGYAVSEN